MRDVLIVITSILIAFFIITVITFKNGTERNGTRRVESSIRGVTFFEREIPPLNEAGKPFLMLETEVTQELYEAVIGLNPSRFLTSSTALIGRSSR